MLISHYGLVVYSRASLIRRVRPSSLVRGRNTPLWVVLFVGGGLLVDCRFPCVWMNSTMFSPASKSHSGPSTVAQPPVSCSRIAPQGGSKCGCFLHFPRSSDA